MKFEYERLSSGVHILSHDEMDDEPVFQVNVADDHVMQKCIEKLDSIALDLSVIKAKRIYCDEDMIGHYKFEIFDNNTDQATLDLTVRFKLEYDGSDSLFAKSPVEFDRIGQSLIYLTDTSDCFDDVIQDLFNRFQ